MDVFATNDMAAMLSIVGTEVTTGSYFNASYTNKALRAPFTSSPFINPVTGAVVTLADGWLHCDMNNATSGSSGGTVLTLLSDTGVSLFRWTAVAGNLMRCDYWNGTTWVTTFSGNTDLGGSTVLNTLDFHWEITPTTVKMTQYVNQSLDVTSVTAAYAGMPNVAKFITSGGSWSNGSFWSQFLVSDTNTVGARVKSLVQNAAGFHTAWTGTYTDLEEVAVNDTSLISSAVLGDKESYLATDATLPLNYYLAGLWQIIRARKSTVSPTNVSPMLRIGGVDYTAPYAFPNLNSASFEGSVACHPVDPSTGLAWSGVTNANAAEIGYQATA